MVVAYLGPVATNTHAAALRAFGESGSYAPCITITQVFEAVASQLNAGMSFVGMLDRRLLELRRRLSAEPKTLCLVPDIHQLR